MNDSETDLFHPEIYLTHKFIWPIDGTLIVITTPSQSGPGSNNNEVVIHTIQIFRSGISTSDAV